MSEDLEPSSDLRVSSWPQNSSQDVISALEGRLEYVNTFFPINRLPTDILLKVFLLLSRFPKPEVLAKRWDWLIVTRVCRYWRDMSLEYPILWSKIDNIFDVDKVRTFLERSQQADLFISLKRQMGTRPDDIPSDILNSIGKNISRLRELAIATQMYNGSVWDNVGNMFMGSSSPVHLKKLSLSIVWDRDYRRCFELPDNISCLGQLEELSLCLLYLPRWSGPTLCGLTKLSLLNINDARKQPNLSELLDILECCPKLRHLQLIKAGPESEPLVSFQERSISLSDIEYIEIVGIDSNDCAILFRCLTLPKDRYFEWHLTCTNHSFDLPSTQSFISKLSGSGGDCSRVRIVFDDDYFSCLTDIKEYDKEDHCWKFKYHSTLYLFWNRPHDWYTTIDRNTRTQIITSMFSYMESILEDVSYKNAIVLFSFKIYDISETSAIVNSRWTRLLNRMRSELSSLYIEFPLQLYTEHLNGVSGAERTFIIALLGSVLAQFNIYDDSDPTVSRNYAPRAHTDTPLTTGKAELSNVQGRKIYQALVEFLQYLPKDDAFIDLCNISAEVRNRLNITMK